MPEPKIAQKSPYVLPAAPGNYAWCSCGASDQQPFCNGAHKGSGMAPVRVAIAEPKTIAWCGCKHSKNPPYCDGSHSKL